MNQNSESAMPATILVQETRTPVKILCIHSSDPKCQFPIGTGRSIQRSGGVFSVPYEEFVGVFQTNFAQEMLKDRIFIVLDGLTDEEREQFGVKYAQNEVLTDEGMFDFFFTGPVEDAAKALAALCPQHQTMVARRFVDAALGEGKYAGKLSRERVEALSEAADNQKLFRRILQTFNVQ